MADTSSSKKDDNALFTTKNFAPLLAGVSGGAVATCLLLPLDNIKVRMQVNEDKRTRPGGGHQRRGGGDTGGDPAGRGADKLTFLPVP